MLVANRGEIALRVVRGARELGIRTVAVYSEPDRGAPHVLHADEAHPIGPARAADSYLNIGRLLEVARRAGVSAVHPGYGFLAERADFAAAVAAAGLVFVGPAPETIRAMGDKTEARRRMEAAGVPVVPGTSAPLASAREARRAAEAVGFPVVLKAAAGGGGKGMRVVTRPGEVPGAFRAAMRESEAAFGDGRVYVERFLERPRHIEVQLFGDAHGNVVHLHERECSIQRRHQKLVEEAPSALLGDDERRSMGAAAVRAARAVDYLGAGTVEFLHQDGEFFFLEMNTRLQVEHPVTEMVTGIDLVEWQFRVAAGEALPMRQADIPLRGHAIECRITSESPFDGFLPATGVVAELQVPGGPGVRWDGGIARGAEVGLHYDPLLGKLIAHGADREAAMRRMRGALRELRIVGVSTSAPLLGLVMDEPDFRAGRVSTRYLDEHPQLFRPEVPASTRRALAAAAALLEHAARPGRASPRIRRASTPLSDWARWGVRRSTFDAPRSPADGPISRRARWGRRPSPPPGPPPDDSNAAPHSGARYVVTLLDKRHDVEIRPDGGVVVDGRAARASLAPSNPPHGCSLLLEGTSFALWARDGRGGEWELEFDGRVFRAEVLDPRVHRIRRLSAKPGAGAKVAPLKAPMPGLVVQVAVDEGRPVAAGDTLLIVEAMKMENELRAPAAATVKRLLAAPGDAVEKGQLLVEFAEAEEP